MQIRIIPLTNAKGLPEEGELVKEDTTYLHLKVVKKGRGKAPATEKTWHIPKATVAYEEVDAVVALDTPAVPAPARRGRKPAVEVSEPVAPKRRGRPPKDKTAEVSAPKKRGRPAKAKPDVTGENTAPKKRGRPPKVRPVGEEVPVPKKPGRKPAAVVTDNPAPKKRGRPPKVKPVVEEAPVAVDPDDEGGEDHRRKKAAAEWNSSFKPEQVKPDKPEKPKVRAAHRPFSNEGEEYGSLDD
jgi:hypothetical protein